MNLTIMDCYLGPHPQASDSGPQEEADGRGRSNTPMAVEQRHGPSEQQSGRQPGATEAVQRAS